MRYFILFLSLAGAVVSALALQVHYSTGTQPCAINSRWDCGIVNHSSYSMMGHIPVAAIGIAGYLALGLLAMAGWRGMFLIAALIGFGFALHLSCIEKNVLDVWCLYCVISQAIIALLTVIGICWFFSGHNKSRHRVLRRS